MKTKRVSMKGAIVMVMMAAFIVMAGAAFVLTACATGEAQGEGNKNAAATPAYWTGNGAK